MLRIGGTWESLLQTVGKGKKGKERVPASCTHRPFLGNLDLPSTPPLTEPSPTLQQNGGEEEKSGEVLPFDSPSSSGSNNTPDPANPLSVPEDHLPLRHPTGLVCLSSLTPGYCPCSCKLQPGKTRLRHPRLSFSFCSTACKMAPGIRLRSQL